MEKYNSLGNFITASKYQLKYDAQCKKLLVNKELLAHILKVFVEEYKNNTIEEIKNFMDGNISVNAEPLEDGIIKKKITDNIIPENSEDSAVDSGTIYYDIKFTAKTGKIIKYKDGKDTAERIELIINIEAQNNIYLNYEMVTRGIYYGSRLISSQKETVFKNEDYEKIKKVYSLWICMSPKKKWHNAINSYNIEEKQLFGNASCEKYDYDKLSVIIIGLNGINRKLPEMAEGNTPYAEILNLLSTLFSTTISKKDKIKSLTEDFNLTLTEKLEKELIDMETVADDWQNEYIQKLITESKKRQEEIKLRQKEAALRQEAENKRQEAEKKAETAEKEGKAKMIVELLEDDNETRSAIEEKLQKKLKINLKEAKKYYLKYSKNAK